MINENIIFMCAAGLNPNLNVNCMEVGGLSLKDPPQPQSRLSQWTHSNSMDSLSGSSSNMENNLNKHGALKSHAHTYRYHSSEICTMGKCKNTKFSTGDMEKAFRRYLEIFTKYAIVMSRLNVN